MHPVHDIRSYDITGKGFDKKVEQMVRVCHMAPLMVVDGFICKALGINIYVSMKSSWRPKWWETSKGRSGYSEHTYNFMGATDITCDDFENNKEVLLGYLMKHTNYTRLAVYNGFIHADYKNEWNDRYVYNSSWVRQYRFNENGPIF